jgi:uncharacterized protein YbjT (DUF2867 family)
MTVLVAGGSGKTGLRLVEQLLALGLTVRVIVRASHALPESGLGTPQCHGRRGQHSRPFG